MNFFSFFVVLISTLLVTTGAVADTINLHVEWTYNGTGVLEEQGFKLYQTASDGTEIVVVDIANPAARSWDGDIEVEEGRSVYELSAYNAVREGPRSKQYPFEYLKPLTEGMPPPTILIRFN